MALAAGGTVGTRVLAEIKTYLRILQAEGKFDATDVPKNVLIRRYCLTRPSKVEFPSEAEA